MKTSEVLDKAADVIEFDGWHQGGYAPDQTEDGASMEGLPVCALGALYRAAEKPLVWSADLGCWSGQDFVEAIDVLTKHVGGRFVPSWNDAKFCCEGGAAAGYIRAGWDVDGVDLQRRYGKRYPGRHFYLMDALDFVTRFAGHYDAIHASPPCQGYSRGNAGRETAWPKLIPAVREALEATGLPYVIENVKDAAPEMHNPVALCGCMFDLSTIDTDGERIHLQRLRMFETTFGITAPRPCDHSQHEWVAGAYGGARRDKHEAKYVRKGGYVPRDKDVVKALLGVEHDMTWAGLFECIPPAYTTHIGHQLMPHLEARAAA